MKTIEDVHSSQNYHISEKPLALKIRTTVVYLLTLYGIFSAPITPTIAWAGVIAYFTFVFCWEAGSHRYFSHRSYKTTRWFHSFLAFTAAASAMRGPLHWAGHHRVHHRFSDTDQDAHSPVTKGFYQSHWGWIFDENTAKTFYDNVKDLLIYPELMWIDKHQAKIRLVWVISIYLLGEYTPLFGATGMGWSSLIWVHCVPILINVHSACVINSVTHGEKGGLFFHRRYKTKDATVNSWLLSLPTLGCSWHNNHHRYMNSARAGFVWWQFDPTYLILKGLSYLGIVWDLVEVPESILKEGFSPESPSDQSEQQRQAAG